MMTKEEIQAEIDKMRLERAILTKKIYKMTRLLKHHSYLFEKEAMK